jgi:hypothetical protein
LKLRGFIALPIIKGSNLTVPVELQASNTVIIAFDFLNPPLRASVLLGSNLKNKPVSSALITFSLSYSLSKLFNVIISFFMRSPLIETASPDKVFCTILFRNLKLCSQPFENLKLIGKLLSISLILSYSLLALCLVIASVIGKLILRQ